MSTVADRLASQRSRQSSKARQTANQEVPDLQKSQDKEVLAGRVWLWSFLDFDKPSNWAWLVIFRLLQACTLTWNHAHPDQLWQGTQPAYDWVYGGVQLPWEWTPEYRLRNTLYPAYLAGPLYVLKQLGLDSQMAVLLQPYLTHSLLVLVGDLFLWKSAKKYAGSDAARLTMLFMLVCRVQTEFIIRCFTNGVEQILSIVAFYYYLDQKDRFTRSTVVLTATITLSFMMRNTSPVGWVPLLAIKVLFEGSLCPFLLAAVVVAVPIMLFTVAIDTWFYLGAVNGKDWVFTSYNFVQMNLVDGLSKFFGTDPWWFYLVVFAPAIFTAMYPAMLTSLFTHLRSMYSKGQTPYLAYYNAFYLLVFSAIPHKEMRFLLPIVPFAFIMISELLSQTIKNGGCQATLASVSIKLFIVVEMAILATVTMFHQRNWEWEHYLTRVKGEPIHSVYTTDSYGSPHFSWFHGTGARVNLVTLNPQFARAKVNTPLPSSYLHPLMLCNQIVGDISAGRLLPEYVMLSEEDEGFVNHKVCERALLNLKRNGKPFYSLEKEFAGDIVAWDSRTGGPRQRYLSLYHLDMTSFAPF